jgi:hypothetical protein
MEKSNLIGRRIRIYDTVFSRRGPDDIKFNWYKEGLIIDHRAIDHLPAGYEVDVKIDTLIMDWMSYPQSWNIGTVNTYDLRGHYLMLLDEQPEKMRYKMYSGSYQKYVESMWELIGQPLRHEAQRIKDAGKFTPRDVYKLSKAFNLPFKLTSEFLEHMQILPVGTYDVKLNSIRLRDFEDDSCLNTTEDGAKTEKH